ncbi:DUF4340 domain-containing protein [Gallaecimonas mangrovi]|uniref:DUF4340 domain-containing protein n=1 Tax=Gallaecimonas mangrovi TaxID=2291597 RepID=UPI000E204FA4|nr:DUF4340 domain-containing protein [Gallaecimonas mangrovi]
MRKPLYVLSALLVVQLLLALGLNLGHKGLQAGEASKTLLALKPADVTEIVLSNPQKSVTLAKKGSDWLLPGSNNFPADNNQVHNLLNNLLALNHTGAVADNNDAAKRFKVAANDFEKKLVLKHGNNILATVFVGTSASMHQAHVRLKGQANIYLVDLPSYQLAVDKSHWQNHRLLSIDGDKIASISTGKLTLTQHQVTAPKGSDASMTKVFNWQLSPMPKGDVVNKDAAQTAINQIAYLRTGVQLGDKAKPDYGLDKPVLSLKVTRTDGSTVSYQLAKEPKGGYILKSSLRPQYFALSAGQAQAMLNAFSLSKLVQNPKAKQAKVASTAPSPSMEKAIGKADAIFKKDTRTLVKQ